jgi:glycosyltransferase involved in cell wall biosynthesis
VQDGVTGRLVPEGDVAALAGAVKTLLADDAGRRALGGRAVGWARRFTWPAVARSVAELYAELLPAGASVAAAASRCRFQL